MHVAVDSGISGKFYVLACIDIALDSAVKHNSGNPYVAFDSALRGKREHMTTVIGRCHVPDNLAVDMQAAGESQITLDRRLRTNQGFNPLGESLFAAEQL